MGSTTGSSATCRSMSRKDASCSQAMSRSPRHRVDAVRLAWQAADVVEVSNELVVGEQGSIAEALSDIVISNELRTLLVFDAEINNLNFNVETVSGVVFITGIARTEAEHLRVLETARTISGVEEVVSYVRVKDS